MGQFSGSTVERSKAPTAIRLLIVDPQPRVRRSLEALLVTLPWHDTAGGRIPLVIVGEATDGSDAIAQAQALDPDVIVLDLPFHHASEAAVSSRLEVDAAATIRTIKRRWPGMRVVVLTMYATERAAALSAGADAFLLKGCATGELVDAICPG